MSEEEMPIKPTQMDWELVKIADDAELFPAELTQADINSLKYLQMEFMLDSSDVEFLRMHPEEINSLITGAKSIEEIRAEMYNKLEEKKKKELEQKAQEAESFSAAIGGAMSGIVLEDVADEKEPTHPSPLPKEITDLFVKAIEDMPLPSFKPSSNKKK